MEISLTLLIAGLRITNTVLAFAAPVSAHKTPRENLHPTICAAWFLLHCNVVRRRIVLPRVPLNFCSPVWCATTTTTCRLIIKLRQIAEDQSSTEPAPSPNVTRSVAVHGEYDELERSGVHVEMLRQVGPSTPIRASNWY
jgi:hypothetical protein